METDMAIDAAGALWSVKKILSAIEKSSFMIEILLFSVTALVVIVTIFLGIKLLRMIFGFLKMAYEKITDKFGTVNFSITSIPKRIFHFIRSKFSKKNPPS